MGAAAALLGLAVTGCGESSSLGPDEIGGGGGTSASLVVEPQSADVSVGDTLQFDARVVDDSGNEQSGWEFTWSVSDPDLASVDGSGEVTGLAQGNVEVLVDASRSDGDQDLSNNARVSVVPQSVAEVSISPSSPSIEMGDTLQLMATVTDEGGGELDRPVKWSSSDPSVAEIDDDGTMIGTGEGQADITARASNVADTAAASVELEPAASVEVTPASVTLSEGGTTQLDATVRDGSGNVLDRSVSWSSSNTSVATVDPLGQVQAQVEGQAQITARSGDASGSAQVTVEASTSAPSMPSGLTVSEDSRTDTSVDYTADWGASDGADSYSWNAGSNNDNWSDSGSGVTDTQASFTAPRSGSDDDSFFCVRAVNSAGESQQACTGFTVPAESGGGGGGGGSPASVSVTPSSTDVEVGNVVQLSATVTDSAGNELDSTVSWSSSNTGVATVSSGGLVTGQAQGTAQITAEVEGITDAASVEVVPAGSGANPFLVEDFSSYGSTSELRNDSRGIYVETDGASHLHLDTSVGLDQGGFDLSQSMRYDFSSSGYPQRVISIEGTNSLWIEVWFRFSTDWRTDLGVDSANPDYKWIFGGTTPSRFEFKTGLFGNNYSASAPQESNVAEPSGSSDEWDGQWHRLRLHFAHESSDGAGDGTIEAWIDDEKIIDAVGTVVTNRSLGPIVRAALGRNHNHLNHGGDPGGTMSLWWGRVALWNADPGW